MHAEIEKVLAGESRYAVVCADNRKVMAELADCAIDHTICDPPFTQRTSNNARTNPKHAPVGDAHRFIDFDGIEPALVAPEILRVTKRWAVLFCALEQLGAYENAAGQAWVRAGVWGKPDGAPQFTGDRPAQSAEGIAIMHRPGRKRWNGGGGRALWIESVVQDRADFGHPTPKPLPLMIRLLEQFTDPGDLIFDPFCGSGTTICAALRTGRRAIGIEINPGYAETAQARCDAESRGLTLRDSRVGQTSIFDLAPVARTHARGTNVVTGPEERKP